MNNRDETPGSVFLRLHQAAKGFLMPNAWDAGSALLMAREGFAAIGTTSAGVAFSLGQTDHGESRFRLTRREAIDRLRQIAQSVDVPVNADLEAGYGTTPEEVGHTVRLAIEAGAAGANIEDVDPATGQLYDIEQAVERVAAARHAIESSGRTFVLNARTDAAQLGGARGMALAIERGLRYVEAGADCVFVPGVSDADRAKLLVRELKVPLNLVIGLNESGSSASRLLDVGVQRVSVGGSIARAALGLVQRAARELRTHGTVSYAAEQIAQSQLNAAFAQARAARPDAAGLDVEHRARPAVGNHVVDGPPPRTTRSLRPQS